MAGLKGEDIACGVKGAGVGTGAAMGEKGVGGCTGVETAGLGGCGVKLVGGAITFEGRAGVPL